MQAVHFLQLFAKKKNIYNKLNLVIKKEKEETQTVKKYLLTLVLTGDMHPYIGFRLEMCP